MSGTFKRRTHSTLKLRRYELPSFRHFTLTRCDGLAGAVTINTGSAQVGSSALNEVQVDEPTVSRFHCEVGVGPGGAWVKDLGSANGTEVDGVRVKEAHLKDGCVLTLGQVALRFSLSGDVSPRPQSSEEAFGPLLGAGAVMRACFAQLERAAETSRPVLLEGETGTGKSAAAEAIHDASARKDEPFLTVDCAALTPGDLEAMLFGRDSPRRLSVFEEAREGAVLLDEVGELSAEHQNRLTTVLERGELRRPGGGASVLLRCRLLATSRVDLRQRVNETRFRNNLFFRLAVVRVVMPPLRQHPEDIPVLVDDYLEAKALTEEEAAPLRTDEFQQRLQASSWQGNVRELHNHLERCLVMGAALPLHDTVPPSRAGHVNPRRSWAEARRLALEQFERDYLEALLRLHRGKVAEAAKAAEVDRVYVYKLLKKYGLKS
ncbi:MAG: sigma 54-interacting transcriptional regulator [Myxococcales bacterium]|nr:sigma 54-interacting transcriptional regulator [Myxococcales bacterium]